MDKSTVLNVCRIVLTVLWRAALTVAAAFGLICVGLTMVLNLVLCGPSETARDELALTLLESEVTRDIPAKFLGENTLARLRSTTVCSGTSDPGLITPGTAAEWAQDPEAVYTYTVQCNTCTAQVELRSDPSGQVTVYADDNCPSYFGFTDAGVLVLSDSPEELGALGVQDLRGNCAVLMMDGEINEKLLTGSSGYAPRIAIGQRADGAIIYVRTDGWTQEHAGATYRDLINIMSEYGAVNACIVYSGSAANEG